MVVDGEEREPPVMTALDPADLRLLPESAKYFVAVTVPPVMVTELWMLAVVLSLSLNRSTPWAPDREALPETVRSPP